MANLTDPARELYDIAEKVRFGTSQKGAEHLAAVFEVEPWSTEFMRILAHILMRADLVEEIISKSQGFDDALKAEAASDLSSFKSAFSGAVLSQTWHDSNGGLGILNNFSPRIKYLSAEVRRFAQYPQLEAEEVIELVEMIGHYLSDIAADQDVPAFARDAVSDGLNEFVFRMTKLRWAGASFTLTAFRDLALLYGELRQECAAREELESAVWLQGFGSILMYFKQKVDSVKGYTDAILYSHAGYTIAASMVGMPALPVLPLPKV